MQDADKGQSAALDGEGLRIGIVRARFNDALTGALAQACLNELAALGVAGITPYAMLEWFWDSRSADWNRRYQQYGVEVELRGRLGAELYVGIQDQSRAASSRVVAVGTALVVRY